MADVERAAVDLRAHLKPTPLEHSRAFSSAVGCEVFLKLESAQPVRSFKVRGALNCIGHIAPERRPAGVITASAGNHGMGVAYAAAAFGLPATVYVPVGANPLKVAAIERVGARVVAAGSNYGEAFVAASAEQTETSSTFVHAYNDPDILAGQGTVALELLQELPDPDTVLVGIGGGGLIGGIGLYLKSRARRPVRLIGVEPAGADSMKRSLDAGRIVTLDRVSTIADGLAASAPGTLTFELARRFVDDVLIVSDEEMLHAIRFLFESEHLLTEPAGAAAAAALLYHHRPKPAEKVVVVVSGANVTQEVLLRALKSGGRE